MSKSAAAAAVSAIFIAGTVFAMWIKKERTKALDERISKLKEQLHNTQKSFADVNKEIANLKDLEFCINVRTLENQREQFRLDLEDVQTKMERIKEKRQFLERQTDKNEEYLRDKQRLLNVQWQLERRKEELENLQLNTEMVLQGTGAEGLMVLIERKTELQHDMKQLHEELKEVTTEREKLQHSWCPIL